MSPLLSVRAATLSRGLRWVLMRHWTDKVVDYVKVVVDDVATCQQILTVYKRGGPSIIHIGLLASRGVIRAMKTTT